MALQTFQCAPTAKFVTQPRVPLTMISPEALKKLQEIVTPPWYNWMKTASTREEDQGVLRIPSFHPSILPIVESMILNNTPGTKKHCGIQCNDPNIKTIPTISELNTTYEDDGKCKIENFTILFGDIGCITFKEKIDLYGTDLYKIVNLDQVGSVPQFFCGFADLSDRNAAIPEEIRKFLVPCTLLFHNVDEVVLLPDETQVKLSSGTWLSLLNQSEDGIQIYRTSQDISIDYKTPPSVTVWLDSEDSEDAEDAGQILDLGLTELQSVPVYRSMEEYMDDF